MSNYVFILFMFNLYCLVNFNSIATILGDTICSKTVVKLYNNVMPR